MTQFLFNMYNHNPLGQRSLEDVISIIGHQLMALGHKAVWNPENKGFLNSDSGVNIIVEGFTPSAVQVLSEVHQQGGRTIILATEEPTKKGFNWGTQLEMIKRQEVFPSIKPFIEGIIHLVPNNPNDPDNPGNNVTGWYNQVAPSAYTELGYAPTLVRKSEPDVEPEYDFGFFGSLSYRRKRLLTKLARRIRSEKAVRVVADFPDQTTRDNAMRNAKVIIQCRKFEAMGLVSSSRCNSALCLGRPVVAEPHLLADPWDKIVHFSKADFGEEVFYNEAIFVLATWKSFWKSQFEKFKTKLTPEVCIGKALHDIGFVEERKK